MGRTTEFRRIALYVVTMIMAGFGFTGVASAQSISNTNNSWGGTTATTTIQNKCINANNVSIANNTSQTAVSGSATTQGSNPNVSWNGWDALDPATAQAQGTSYNAWQNNVITWISNRANGAGWMSDGSGPSWSPSGNDWSSYNPMLWQANGQTFTNWYNAVESYLNNNGPSWLLSWPPNDNASDAIGAVSGNATNNNNADFSINIDNAASSHVTTSSCSQVSPASCPCGGSGLVAGDMSGSTKQATQSTHPENTAPQSTGSYGGSGYSAPGYYSKSTPQSSQQVPSPGLSVSQGPSTTNGPAASCPPSSNTVTTPTSGASYQTAVNTSNVNVNNASSQMATTASAASTGSISGASSSGNAANGNGANVSIGVNQ